MARRLLSVSKIINDFVERNKDADETDFFQKLRDEVEGAEVGDYAEGFFIDIIYGDYIFTVYKVDSRWVLSDNIVLLIDDDNSAYHTIIDLKDIIEY